MLSTTSKDFLNTVGIYCYKRKSSRTNLRSIMYDVRSEPDYPLCIVNVGKNLNLIATPNKQINPLVSNALDMELQTGSLPFLESKILIDFKLMLPSQGDEEDDCCLLLFFHKQSNTWKYEDNRESEPVKRNTTPNDAEEESSLQEDVTEARPGSHSVNKLKLTPQEFENNAHKV